MEEFLLHELNDQKLCGILSLPPKEQVTYFSNLVEKYYPHAMKDTEEFYSLVLSYKSSFALEKKYRKNESIQESFTAVYTKTGLIRELVNDLYYIDESLITH